MSDTQKVRVYNDGEFAIVEDFKGDIIRIPPKRFILMDFYEAHEFKGQYKPIQVDGAGVHQEQSFKKVRVVMPDHFKLADQGKIICNFCGVEFKSNDELSKHLKVSHDEHRVKDDKDK